MITTTMSTVTSSPRLCYSSSSPNISFDQSTINVHIDKLKESDQCTINGEHNTETFNKILNDLPKSSSSLSPSCSSFTSLSSSSSSSALTTDSSINPSTCSSDTLWSNSKSTAIHNIANVDKFKQLRIDIQDSRYEDDENQKEVNFSFVCLHVYVCS